MTIVTVGRWRNVSVHLAARHPAGHNEIKIFRTCHRLLLLTTLFRGSKA
jgi:hypothetical protein